MAPTLTVGVDGIPASRSAALWAAEEAALRDALLRVVRVQPPGSSPDTPDSAPLGPHHTGSGAPGSDASGPGPADSRPGGSGPTDSDPAGQRPAGGELLIDPSLAPLAHDLTDRHPGLRLDALLLPGEPKEALRELSRSSDLLVVGSRGLGAVRGFLVGSVALPTVAQADCPVVLVRAGTESGGRTGDEGEGDEAGTGARGGETAPPGGIAVGVDVHTPCEEMLRFAFDEARIRSAPLKVRHGWNPPPVYGARPFPLAATALEDVLATRADALTRMLRPWCAAYPDVTVDARAVLTPPTGLLVETAADASLLVVGRNRRRPLLVPHLGPITHGVLNHAPAPVAVVPHT
ncbi:universal stress protein [Streptomyces iconiensis]|uniref:Universal stress protein n=1 Tax=Streptomyces iconiensis TaxID=1384038 RepID=A0ABT6ZQ03_9ACTN|nr:universal stress protein [Streptomyces iconiensis]MDJ1130751.1 universal stress protein [Streptomyces iconiensis]